MKFKFLTIALALTTLVACQNTNDKKAGVANEGANTTNEAPPTMTDTKPIMTEKNPAVIGKWKGVEWYFMGKPSGEDATKVQFDFKEDGTFKANYGDQHKSGTWRTAKDSLYTTQLGKKELPIKLLKVDGSSLEMEMDVKGKPEVIKFKRQ